MTRKDLHQQVTDRIIAALEEGVIPWKRPWRTVGGELGGGLPYNGKTHRRYRGVNIPLLWLSRMENGFTTDEWMSYKQAKSRGGQVRKGEKSTMVVFWKPLHITDDETGERKQVWMIRYYNVFNRDQIEGLPSLEVAEPEKSDDPEPPDNYAMQEIHEWLEDRHDDLTIRFGGNQAYYNRDTDHVQMPKPEQFHDVDGFASSLFHETVHWSGAPHRLDRTKGSVFGSKTYAVEELVAELGAAFLCAEWDLDATDNSAAYIDSWLRALRKDKKWFFSAASAAQKAVDYIAGETTPHAANVEEAA